MSRTCGFHLAWTCLLSFVAGCSRQEAEQPEPIVLVPASAAPTVDPVPVAPTPAPSRAIEALLAAEDRTPDGRALDPGRRPAELLSYFDVRAGLRVAELGASSGYTAELLARAVAPDGVVYGQHSRFVLDKFAEGP